MFQVTPDEIARAREKYFASSSPIKLIRFPAKEKQKYLVLFEIIKAFDVDRMYHEKEVNAILEVIYFDYVTIRRYLIDYGFMQRKTDGSSYWVVEQTQPDND
ncbi:MAG: DUF2087 domain-containing protein [Candidatus Izemoplasmatales bacterium]|nr:DUF2087 domain-containing protein [Candidatus Izemoplasmatales bacterium]